MKNRPHGSHSGFPIAGRTAMAGLMGVGLRPSGRMPMYLQRSRTTFLIQSISSSQCQSCFFNCICCGTDNAHSAFLANLVSQAVTRPNISLSASLRDSSQAADNASQRSWYIKFCFAHLYSFSPQHNNELMPSWPQAPMAAKGKPQSHLWLLAWLIYLLHDEDEVSAGWMMVMTDALPCCQIGPSFHPPHSQSSACFWPALQFMCLHIYKLSCPSCTGYKTPPLYPAHIPYLQDGKSSMGGQINHQLDDPRSCSWKQLQMG